MAIKCEKQKGGFSNGVKKFFENVFSRSEQKSRKILRDHLEENCHYRVIAHSVFSDSFGAFEALLALLLL